MDENHRRRGRRQFDCVDDLLDRWTELSQPTGPV
jgi:hypothetical protein